MSDDATTDGCSIAATLAAVGDRWTLLILRDLFRGVRRFERLHQDIGISRNEIELVVRGKLSNDQRHNRLVA